MNLQLFAEKGGEEPNLDADENEDAQEEEEEIVLTQKELEAKLQAEADRRVTQALKKQERKLESKLKEAEKLRNMDEEQKKMYEIEQREAEIAKKEKEFAIMENKIECSNILSERGLPQEFLEYVVAEDAEQMMENIKRMDKVFKAAVADEVQNKIQSKVPGQGNDSQKGMTKEKFNSLSIAQQSEIYRNNPELYKQMTT